MKEKFFLAIDQGTSSSRAILYNSELKEIASHQIEFESTYPNPSWVEQDPDEIFNSEYKCITEVLKEIKNKDCEIFAGITNQRETTILWNRNNSQAVYPAIVWQDMRTAEYCAELKTDYSELVSEKTGLVLDSYFSASKIKWILDSNREIRKLAESGELCFGTVDTWLIWKLSGASQHLTDHSNASRTMLFNIHNLDWDQELLALFSIPKPLLPEIKCSQDKYLDFEVDGFRIQLVSVAGDQNASLFGHLCFDKGEAKNTYGTGCFLLSNTGEEIIKSKHGLLSTVAFTLSNKKVNYALEGSIFIAGAVIKWLKEQMNFFDNVAESEKLARLVPDKEMENLYFIPAFAGLGSPYWDMFARAIFIGMSLETGKNHMVRACLESLAYQTKDVIQAMEIDSSSKITSLSVDGGVAQNEFMLEFLANILEIEVTKKENLELTAFGIVAMAANHIGSHSLEDLKRSNKVSRSYISAFDNLRVEKLYSGWNKAISRSKDWLLND